MRWIATGCTPFAVAVLVPRAFDPVLRLRCCVCVCIAFPVPDSFTDSGFYGLLRLLHRLLPFVCYVRCCYVCYYHAFVAFVTDYVARCGYVYPVVLVVCRLVIRSYGLPRLVDFVFVYALRTRCYWITAAFATLRGCTLPRFGHLRCTRSFRTFVCRTHAFVHVYVTPQLIFCCCVSPF